MKNQKSIRSYKVKIIKPTMSVQSYKAKIISLAAPVVLGVPKQMEHYNVMVAYKRGWWFIGSGVRILKRA